MDQSFEKKVLRSLGKIPRGRVTTYKGLARIAGNPRAYRAAGNAAHKNPNPVIVPCHRVVRSDGRIGGYGGGVKKKIVLLAKAGVVVRSGRIDLKLYGWKI